MNIIHEPSASSPFLVVAKPCRLPSAPLFEGDESVLTEAMKEFPEIAHVHGKKEVEHGLVHRIDTPTSGLVLIATTQESYDSLIRSQKEGMFEKWYRAEVEKIPDCAARLGGFPPLPLVHAESLPKNFCVRSAFRAFGSGRREVRPVVHESGRAAQKKARSAFYETDISFEAETIALCHIRSGFRHQVRCHLAWCGFPVLGDSLYNPNERTERGTAQSENSEKIMRFEACRISFPHPLTGIPQVFET